MRGYINECRRLSDQSIAAAAAEQAAAVQLAAKEHVQMDVQIQQLFAAMTPAQRQRPFTMAELLPRLSGKYKALPHPMLVGAALRRLNFRSVRDWSVAGRGARVWVRVDVQS
ncbi:MAG: hypothetical protein D4R79_02365 [Comamonadaceae bacterium]|nr:MAG: hypothetical protein D4R79_02365 [Comamonadaceae bacterium]